MSRVHALLAIVFMGLATLTGCSSHGVAKSGGALPPLILTVATDDDDDRPAGKQILHFGEEVERLSKGTIQVEPAWQAAGEDNSQWDQAVAKRVAAGDNDLGLIPSRAWDALGVTSLRALNTPFLITDDTTLDAVVGSDVVPDLLSGLPKTGVSGISLFPEGLRHPFGFGSPILSVTDYRGGTIRSPYSETTYALLEALGAEPTDAELNQSTMRGAESSFALTPGGTATGNVVLFPKVNVLVINNGVRANLSNEQLDTLTEAAAATERWILDTRPTDAEEAATWCDSGGKIAAASQRQITALHQAAAPVIAKLRSDTLTADLIDRITALVDVSGTTPITNCRETQ